MGTAAAAGTYPTKAELCSALGSMLTCTMLEDKTACDANTDCLWYGDDPDDSFCSVSESISMQMDYAFRTFNIWRLGVG